MPIWLNLSISQTFHPKIDYVSKGSPTLVISNVKDSFQTKVLFLVLHQPLSDIPTRCQPEVRDEMRCWLHCIPNLQGLPPGSCWSLHPADIWWTTGGLQCTAMSSVISALEWQTHLLHHWEYLVHRFSDNYNNVRSCDNTDCIAVHWSLLEGKTATSEASARQSFLNSEKTLQSLFLWSPNVNVCLELTQELKTFFSLRR